MIFKNKRDHNKNKQSQVKILSADVQNWARS